MALTITLEKTKSKRIRILHLASFSGNIGDNISHIGFKNLLNQLHLDLDITRLEIRKFYNNYNLSDKRFFNQELISEINSYDGCIIGGRGLYEL
ncbi:hypothetical protein [Helicobacter sp. UBA3407]|uniref:hypothetical protein n=1 Tax=Helicobacter sp. UBA3407 TaxID=1946588 RepID=UPI00261120D0|nr:hypothetical protein [Helicobacter sp. UBA3407]